MQWVQSFVLSCLGSFFGLLHRHSKTFSLSHPFPLFLVYFGIAALKASEFYFYLSHCFNIVFLVTIIIIIIIIITALLQISKITVICLS